MEHLMGNEDRMAGDTSTEIPVTLANASHSQPNNGNGTSYRMPTYLIAVICLSIFLGVIVMYKLYNHVRTKKLRIPCCVEGPQKRSDLLLRDTFSFDKPLIRTASDASNGSGHCEQQSLKQQI